MKFDRTAINNATDLVALIRRTVDLKQQGRYWVGNCPNHNDTHASFKVNVAMNVWRCHSQCGDDFSGRGAVSWMVDGLGIPFVEACKQLTGAEFSDAVKASPNSYVSKAKPEPEVIMPIPPDAQRTRPMEHRKFGIPVLQTCYKSESGAPLFYEYRWNNSEEFTSTGKIAKIFFPLCWTVDGWKFMAPPAPRPIYGLDRLAAKPNSPVAIFEGSKCADYAQSRLASTVCISWQGGANAAGYSDWEVLRGRRVVLCADHDLGGWKCMDWLGSHLLTMGCKVSWAVNPTAWTKAMDVADTGWESAELTSYLRGAVPFADRGENFHVVVPAADVADVVEELPALAPPSSDDPFIHLGYSRSGKSGREYWYYIKSQGMLFGVTPSAMSDPAFLMLGSLTWWEHNFTLTRGKIDRVRAINMLIQAGNEIGMFDPLKIKGRGAWMDRGRMVLHCGNQLIVDNVRQGLDIDSDFIYEQKPALIGKLAAPMKLADANKYLKLCQMMHWDAPVMAYLMAGWVAIAPLCGLLPWRPHLWVVGPSKVGKSTISKWLVNRMLGKLRVFAQGSGTTEPGIRAALANDAIPCIIDEMEGNSVQAKTSVSNILTLIRSMSTHDSGGIS